MKVLVQIGSCGASWPENTTPIQRLKVISDYFDRVILVDTELKPTPHLHIDAYIQVSRFTPNAIWEILRKYRGEDVLVWFGPSHRVAMIVLILKLVMKLRFVVDLYDHEQLSSGIASARGAKIRAIKYRLIEGFTQIAARRADLLVSAIAEDRYKHQSNRVKAINGVATNAIAEIVKSKSVNIDNAYKSFTICYVGLINKERSGILADLAAAAYGTKVKIILIGDNDKDFLNLIKMKASHRSEVSIVAHGFMPWQDAMRLVADVDLCLYPFPHRPELDCVYPIKMGEYMFLGKPVIATDSTAIREVYSECIGVIRCKVDQPEAWVSAIKTLADHDGKRRELGAANHAFACNLLDWGSTQSMLLLRLRALLDIKTENI